MPVDLDPSRLQLVLGQWRICIVAAIPAGPGRGAQFRPVHVTGLDFSAAQEMSRVLVDGLVAHYPGALVYQRVMPRADSPSTFVADVRNLPRVKDLVGGT